MRGSRKFCQIGSDSTLTYVFFVFGCCCCFLCCCCCFLFCFVFVCFFFVCFFFVFCFFFGGGGLYLLSLSWRENQNTTKVSHHRPTSETHFFWRFAGGPIMAQLGSFVIFQGIWNGITKKPYSFENFPGVRTPTLDPRMSLIIVSRKNDRPVANLLKKTCQHVCLPGPRITMPP